MIFIVMDNGNGPPARIEISENKDEKLLSQLEWPYAFSIKAIYPYTGYRYIYNLIIRNLARFIVTFRADVSGM